MAARTSSASSAWLKAGTARSSSIVIGLKISKRTSDAGDRNESKERHPSAPGDAASAISGEETKADGRFLVSTRRSCCCAERDGHVPPLCCFGPCSYHLGSSDTGTGLTSDQRAWEAPAGEEKMAQPARTGCGPPGLKRPQWGSAGGRTAMQLIEFCLGARP